MKLESQVTSLDLAKRLKELGVKQESIVGWRMRHILNGHSERLSSAWVVVTNGFFEDWIGDESVAAFTVAELFSKMSYGICLMQRENDYACFNQITHTSKDFGVHADKSPADAVAKMLIYLLENHLLDTTK